jgi:TolA-binding protein
MAERDRLISRIRQMRRASARADEARGASAPPRDTTDEQLAQLRGRIEELEHLIQGLQDSVHRESTRQGKRIARLEEQIQPAALGRALSEDARERGL